MQDEDGDDRSGGGVEEPVDCWDGLAGLPDAIGATWPTAVAQTSSVDTVGRRDGLAGHRAARGGPVHRCAFEAQMQTCRPGWRRAA
jgi:hypothetical protein